MCSALFVLRMIWTRFFVSHTLCYCICTTAARFTAILPPILRLKCSLIACLFPGKIPIFSTLQTSGSIKMHNLSIFDMKSFAYRFCLIDIWDGIKTSPNAHSLNRFSLVIDCAEWMLESSHCFIFISNFDTLNIRRVWLMTYSLLIKHRFCIWTQNSRD